MKITYDLLADAAYIAFTTAITPGQVARTYTCNPTEVGGQINLDFDVEGRLLGVEVLNASKGLPLEALDFAEHIE